MPDSTIKPDLHKLAAELAISKKTYAINQTALAKIVPAVKAQTAEGVSGENLLTRKIFAQFKFHPQPNSFWSRGLRPQLVEPLLQQAATYVNRVLAEEPLYRQLIIDRLNLYLDTEELSALEAINSDEVSNGAFVVPFWDASAALATDEALSTSTQAQRK